MKKYEKEERFYKKLKVLAVIFGLLSLINIIILINRNSSYALFRRHVQSKRVIEIHTTKEFPLKGETLIDKLNATLTTSNYVTDSDGTKFYQEQMTK